MMDREDVNDSERRKASRRYKSRSAEFSKDKSFLPSQKMQDHADE